MILNKAIQIAHNFIMASLLIMSSCVPITTNQQSTNFDKLIYDDVNYDQNVGQVQIFNRSNSGVPVTSINDPGVVLQFDLLEQDADNLYVNFIHCNSDWKPSGLADIRFLDEYNSFQISNIEYSANTRIPYVQYRLELPTPIISGNYLLRVYRADRPEDLVLTRRLLVFSNLASIDPEVRMSDNLQFRNQNQQVVFSINFSAIPNANIYTDFKTVILQNHRWQSAIFDLRPSLIRNDQLTARYDNYMLENNFTGLNEFRFFDLRTTDVRSMNVLAIDKQPEIIKAFINPDKSRAPLAYTQINDDMNGNYFIENRDPNDIPLQNEYVLTHFELQSAPVNGKVFVTGRFNTWQLNSSNEMHYDSAALSYKGSLLMKQGYYDYMYWLSAEELNAWYFEGNFSQTENQYEILCYYQNPANNFDELVGYIDLTGRL